jgi:hypothetical protein
MKDDRPGQAMMVYLPAQSPVADGDRRRYTNMYETRNETNRRPVTCGETHGPPDLTFRLCGGFAGPRRRSAEGPMPWSAAG